MKNNIYCGPLNVRDGAMNPEARRAYVSWKDQRRRNHVSYGAREFIAWWLDKIKDFNGNRPTCGRKDHSKGYSFDNIELQDASENSRERCDRLGAPALLRRRKIVMDGIIFESVRDACRKLNLSPGTVGYHLKRKNGRAKYVREIIEKSRRYDDEG